MSYREHVIWTKLPEGFTCDELHKKPVLFANGHLEHLAELHVCPKSDKFFEIVIVVKSGDGSRFKETFLHQTDERLFDIERLPNRPGEAAFRLSCYTPSTEELTHARKSPLPDLDVPEKDP